MAQNLFRTVQRLLDVGGAIEPGAIIEVYTAGTTSPLTLYSDRGLTTTAGYTVTADATGAVPERWIADTVKFKLIYKDADGVPTFTRDYANDNNEPTAAENIWVVANNAALKALTASTGLIDNGVYVTLGYSTERDRGEGIWVYDASATDTANTGTILAPLSGAGRFFRIHEGWTFHEAWGGKADDTGLDNATARNLWRTAAAAGTAPVWVKFGEGVYYYATTPALITGITNARLSGVGPGKTIQMQHYTTTTQTDALIGFGADAPYGLVEDMELAMADTYRGGSAICYIADSSQAPSSPRGRNVTVTTFNTKPNLTISSFTTASPGVITTSTAHGFATDEIVNLDALTGGTFYTLGARFLKAVVTGPTTLSLKDRDTGVAIDTSSLGSWSAGTIRSANAFEWGIYADGILKATGSLGIRVMNFEEMEIFGCARGAMKLHGVSTFRFQGATYSAGYSGFCHISGTAGVNSDSIIFVVSDIGGLDLDRATSIKVVGDVAGDIIDTANTADRHVWGEVAGIDTALGSYTTKPAFIRLPNGMVRQYLAATGLGVGSATKSWPVPFIATPVNYGASYPYTGTVTTPTATGIDIADATNATGRYWAEGYV